MTNTIPIRFDDTPDYDSFHQIFDEQAASNELADHLDAFGKTEIDLVGDWGETPGGDYPTVEQIESTFAPASVWPTVAQIEAALVLKEDAEPQS